MAYFLPPVLVLTQKKKTKIDVGRFFKAKLCIQEPARPGKLIHCALNLDVVFSLSTSLSEWSISAMQATLDIFWQQRNSKPD